MNTVRFGVIGIGNMGTHHTRYLNDGLVEGATLSAICDIDPAKLAKAPAGPNVGRFSNHRDMLNSGTVDGAGCVCQGDSSHQRKTGGGFGECRSQIE
jgi:predicted dehydrogenase